MKYKELVRILLEKNYKYIPKKSIILEDSIVLKYHTVDVKIEKNVDDRYNLIISSILDPNIIGYVEYETEEHAMMAYDAIIGEGYGYIVDYLFRNCKDHGTAMSWSKIVVDEIKANFEGFDKKNINVDITPVATIDNMQ
jgi:hypothetical protein